MGKDYYNEEQVRTEALQFFNGDILATNVWIKKYALKNKDENGYLEKNPDDTIKRLATQIHKIEEKYSNPLTFKEIYKTIKDFKYFIFGGSIMFGLGNPNNVSLGNCFFIDNESDSYGGIMNIDESMAQLMKRRGGVGITMENLRPATSKVNNSAASSTGAVCFMERYSNTTREVAQDGRRGALMISMHVNHPDVTEFVSIKNDLKKVTGANVSVKVTDEFMRAVEADQDFILSWPVQDRSIDIKEQLPYNKLVKLGDKQYVKRIKAKELWNSIVYQAHKNAEPGVLFWDNIIKESPADCYSDIGFKTKGTNPCGEVPLSAFDSCRLGSINLYSFVNKPFSAKPKFDWNKLAKISRYAQRFMDDIVDLEEEKVIDIIKKIKSDPENIKIKRTEIEVWEEVLEVLRKGRRTGIGILGLGDALAAMGIKYGSKESVKFAEEITKYVAVNAYRETVKLAGERGSFPSWNADKEAGNPFIVRVISNNFDNDEYEEYLEKGRRNIASLSIAPTGTLAIEAQTTSGMEPVFKIFYRRRRKVNPNEDDVKVSFVDQNGDSWEEYNVIHYPFITWYHEKFVNEGVKWEETAEYLNALEEKALEELVSESPWGGAEAHDVDYINKIDMQGAIQKWVDHSISVTHNLPEKITLNEVNDIYFHGWKSGCKGLTIYREGSRSGVLLTGKEKEAAEFKESKAPKRPKVLPADYYIAKAQGKEFAIIVGRWVEPDGTETNKPYEIFAFENPPGKKNTKGKLIKVKKGHYKFVNGEFEIEDVQLAAESVEQRMLTLTASMLLRHGAPIPHVIKVMKKIDDGITTFSSVCRRYLSRYIEEEIDGESCPHCHDKLIMQDGCVKCVNPECGYSRCG